MRTPPGDALPAYAELHCRSNFSFLSGASHPHELVARAAELGYSALALTDECSLAGAVRAHVAAKTHGLKLLLGSQFRVEPEGTEPPEIPEAPEAQAMPDRPGLPGPGPGAAALPSGAFTLLVLACTLTGYGNLCQFITGLRRAAPKGSYRLLPSGVRPQALADCVLIALPDPNNSGAQIDQLARWLLRHFMGRCWLGVTQQLRLDDALRLQRLRHSSALSAVPLVALGDVQMHRRSRKPLHDLLCATRLNRPLSDCGWALAPNAEQRLRSRLLLAQRFPADLLQETLRVAERCQFSLDELRYQYPDELVPRGLSASQYLRQLSAQGAQRRWPGGTPPAVAQQIEHELGLIAELGYEPYFLSVYDIVAFARGRGILCQGRGSAANSAVCYCLGITEVDPARSALLFERFISRERKEPPDIDVDFEHQRREEVVQYLYRKYGRERAALTAAVVCYRPRSALRDAARALGLPSATLALLIKDLRGWDGGPIAPERLQAAGLDPEQRAVRLWLALSTELLGFPRHLSQHSGGFVLTRLALSRMVPIENATMPERTLIQWDKNDLDALGLLKVDVLALGMLSAIRRALALIAQRLGRPFGLQDIPGDDPATFDMFCAADTVGVFQIESRAQMAMLPRLRPRCFYDLVIEVALVRPGPIQGGAVHPYLDRRQGKAPVSYPSEALRQALQRTLGVPIFQEQCMQIAILAAGFSPGEADGLRRAMAAWGRHGGLEPYQQRLVQGMTERGHTAEFAQSVFEQIKGFASYGFPESHAASFALLVYASGWIKRHYPAEFLLALLNSQPMGFYTPRQLVQDAQRHGVRVLPVDVSHSGWESQIEDGAGLETQAGALVERPGDSDGRTATGPTVTPPPRSVRLGLHLVSGLGRAAAQRIEAARRLAGGRTWGVESESRPQRGQFLPDLPPHGPAMGQKDGEKWTAVVDLEPTNPKSNSLLRPFADTNDLAERAGLEPAVLRLLAAADALASLSGHRRQQVWAAAAWRPAPPLLRTAAAQETPCDLPEAPEGEAIAWDHASLGLSLRRHPLALLRPQLRQRRMQTAAELQQAPNGRLVRHAGIVTLRQQPSTANGVLFLSLEDETGVVQVIVWKALRERQRSALLGARLLVVRGVWQRDGEVGNLIAGHLENLNPLLGSLSPHSRDFH